MFDSSDISNTIGNAKEKREQNASLVKIGPGGDQPEFVEKDAFESRKKSASKVKTLNCDFAKNTL